MSFEHFQLEELAAPIKNAIVGGPFGSNLVSKDYVDAGVPVIRGQNMGGKWVTGEFVFVSPEKAEQLAQNKARPGDLVFTQRGTLGQVSIVPCGPYPEYIVSQSQMKITLDPEKADIDFIYYLFKSEQQLRYILNSAIQTGVPHTNLGILRKTPVATPSLGIQHSIGKLLSILDDRIALLRETNATLEAIAQALFKSWFVDFDPVHARVGAPLAGAQLSGSGRAQGSPLPDHLAALFPDSFEESALGMIPKGWKVGMLANLCNRIESGGTPKRTVTEYWNGSISWLTSGEVRNPIVFETKEKISELGLKESSAKLWPTGTTVIAMYGATAGEVCLIARPSTANQACCGLIAKSATRTFTFLCARREQGALASKSSGSAQQNLNKGLIENHAIVLPSEELFSAYENIAGAMLDSWIANEQQAQTLAQLRDTLLPKLISGQLRLPEAEALLAEELP